MTLYEISVQYQEFLQMVEEGEIPEEAVADTLEGLDGVFEEKADNIACYIKNLRAEAAAIKEEASALNERAKAKSNRADSLQGALLAAMISTGRKEIETTRNRMRVRLNPPCVAIPDVEAFILWAAANDKDGYLSYAPPKPDKLAIKAALDGGAEIPGVTLERRQSLTIR